MLAWATVSANSVRGGRVRCGPPGIVSSGACGAAAAAWLDPCAVTLAAGGGGHFGFFHLNHRVVANGAQRHRRLL